MKKMAGKYNANQNRISVILFVSVKNALSGKRYFGNPVIEGVDCWQG
jgi:hypothetical protein